MHLYFLAHVIQLNCSINTMVFRYRQAGHGTRSGFRLLGPHIGGRSLLELNNRGKYAKTTLSGGSNNSS